MITTGEHLVGLRNSQRSVDWKKTAIGGDSGGDTKGTARSLIKHSFNPQIPLFGMPKAAKRSI